jgi:hypothetical protein
MQGKQGQDISHKLAALRFNPALLDKNLRF